MKPRKNYRTRPKKSGARRAQRVKSQIKRLTETGLDEKELKKKTTVEIRALLNETARKQAKEARTAGIG